MSCGVCTGEMLVSTISEFYDDPRNRPGVVDLCQKLGMLPEMLAEQPFHLDLHVLAAQRGHLRLNDWLLEQRGGPNKEALVQVLSTNACDTAVRGGNREAKSMLVVVVALDDTLLPPAAHCVALQVICPRTSGSAYNRCRKWMGCGIAHCQFSRHLEFSSCLMKPGEMAAAFNLGICPVRNILDGSCLARGYSGHGSGNDFVLLVVLGVGEGASPSYQR